MRFEQLGTEPTAADGRAVRRVNTTIYMKECTAHGDRL